MFHLFRQKSRLWWMKIAVWGFDNWHEPNSQRQSSRDSCLRKDKRSRLKLQSSDAELRIDTGPVTELIEALFPSTILPPVEAGQREYTKDNAYFTLKGASTSAIAALFSQTFCAGIEISDLRVWKKHSCLLDTTDCLTMEVPRRTRHYDMIILRVGYVPAMKSLESCIDMREIKKFCIVLAW